MFKPEDHGNIEKKKKTSTAITIFFVHKPSVRQLGLEAVFYEIINNSVLG